MFDFFFDYSEEKIENGRNISVTLRPRAVISTALFCASLWFMLKQTIMKR